MAKLAPAFRSDDSERRPCYLCCAVLFLIIAFVFIYQTFRKCQQCVLHFLKDKQCRKIHPLLATKICTQLQG